MKPGYKKIISLFLWILFVLLAIITGLYPGFYFMLDRRFSLLAFVDDDLLNNWAWNIAFYIHIVTAGFSLLIGWLQFSEKLRFRRPALHRSIGKLYIFSSLPGAVAGFCLSFSATGGLISESGFGVLAVFWFGTTLMAFINARKNRILQHRRMAFYSYAACFAAVTLRLWLQLFLYSGMEFMIAYPITAWLSWLPNVAVAGFLIRKKQRALHT